MWLSLARIILRFGYVWLAILLALTVYFGWQASQVKLSYEFSKAIPTDNPKYLVYQEFRKKYGDDGNLLVIGVQITNLFQQNIFNDYVSLARSLKSFHVVTDVISLASAVNLVRAENAEKLQAIPVFGGQSLSQPQIDS